MSQRRHETSAWLSTLVGGNREHDGRLLAFESRLSELLCRALRRDAPDQNRYSALPWDNKFEAGPIHVQRTLNRIAARAPGVEFPPTGDAQAEPDTRTRNAVTVLGGRYVRNVFAWA